MPWLNGEHLIRCWTNAMDGLVSICLVPESNFPSPVRECSVGSCQATLPPLSALATKFRSHPGTIGGLFLATIRYVQSNSAALHADFGQRLADGTIAAQAPRNPGILRRVSSGSGAGFRGSFSCRWLMGAMQQPCIHIMYGPAAPRRSGFVQMACGSITDSCVEIHSHLFPLRCGYGVRLS